MSNYEFRIEIEMLIASKREGDYWDFKEMYHEKKPDLLHDIICMANNRADRDAYIIFGVSDDYVVKGIEGDVNRKTQQNLIDFLKGKKFGGGIRPTIEMHTIFIYGKEVDVLVIKNSTDTPYFLTEDYQYQKRAVRANYIYTRVGDTNTDIDKSADINHIEYLWRKRFLLNRPPLEQIKQKLRNKEEWKSDGDMYYNVYNPEYTVNLEDDRDRGYPEFYSFLMMNSSTSYGTLELRYFGTKLFGYQFVILDGGRFVTAVPEMGFVAFDEYNRDETYSYMYFMKGSLKYILHKFLSADDHEAVLARKRLYGGIVVFKDDIEKNLFEEYLLRNKQLFYEKFSSTKDSHEWIDVGNEHEKQYYQHRIKTGKVMKKLLEKFREEFNTYVEKPNCYQ